MINFDSLVNNFWHFGAHISELSKPGDYVRYAFFDEDVVLYNDGQKIIAFDNICPHRGARFYSEHYGNSMAVCKYHGLTIVRGQIHFPSNESSSECTYDIKRYQVDFCGSLVFFAIDPKMSLLDQFGEGIFDLIEAISFDCHKLVDVNSYEYECNALIAVENALEPDHVPFVHADTLYPLNLINVRNEFYGYNSIVKFDIGNQRINKGLDRILKFFDTGSQRFDGYMSIHMFPFGFISSTCGNSYSIQNFFPISENKSSFTSKIYFSNLRQGVNADVVSHFVNSTILVNKKVFDEDHDICKTIKFSSWLKLFNEPLTVSEIKIKKFRENIKVL